MATTCCVVPTTRHGTQERVLTVIEIIVLSPLYAGGRLGDTAPGARAHTGAHNLEIRLTEIKVRDLCRWQATSHKISYAGDAVMMQGKRTVSILR